MVVELDAEPATLLPLVHPDWLSWTIEGHLVLESLVRVDAQTGLLTGELAESWEVDSPRTRWTFHMRKGAKWHDGTPVSADDVVFTFDRLLDPTVGSPDRALFAGARVVKLPSGDVEVRLRAPLASADVDFDRILILPRHRFPRGDLTRAEDASAPIGTGPMQFSTWVRGREIVLVRNPSYWGPAAPTPRLTFRFVTSPPAVLAAIEHGDIDVVPRATVELAEQVEARPALAASYEVVRAGGFDYTAWIHNVTSPKLKDVRVRRALGLAIPRAQLRSEVERCGVQLALGPLPPGHEALAGIDPPRYDATEAARLLGEAGITDTNGDGVRDWGGQSFRLTLIYPASSRQQERAATVIAEELRRLGVDLKLAPVEWAEFLHRLELHDFELAFAGRTSEDVGAGLGDGSFGMAEETGAFLNRAAAIAADEGRGLGEIVGREIVRQRLKHRKMSIFASAYEMGAPATVHVAIGADIIHMHPGADGAAIGKATFADFHRLAEVIGTLSRGVVLNLGSAVIMPEVFLKALNLCRNLGRKVRDFTTADMDFVRHYRPRVNVVERPTQGGGRGIMLTGHHEIMFPLLAAAVKEELRRRA